MSTLFALTCLRDEPGTCESARALAARLWAIRPPENVPAGDPASIAAVTALISVAAVPVLVTAVVLVAREDGAPTAVADAAAVAAADDDDADADAGAGAGASAESAGGLSCLLSSASISATPPTS